MYPPPINSRPIATAIGISNPPTVITQPSIVVRPIETPASRSRITLCRYSGRWSLYFDTRVLITNRLLTRPFSTIRSGSGATLTPSGPLQFLRRQHGLLCRQHDLFGFGTGRCGRRGTHGGLLQNSGFTGQLKHIYCYLLECFYAAARLTRCHARRLVCTRSMPPISSVNSS